jgi:hypothetical protein
MNSRLDPLEDTRPGYGRRGVAELVGGAGSAAALILGVIYGVGALVKTAELRNADVDVGAAFPLIPIQQHLSRGIEIFLAPGTLAIVAAVFVFGAVIHRFPVPRWNEDIGIKFDGGLLITVPNAKPPRAKEADASGGESVASQQEHKASNGKSRSPEKKRLPESHWLPVTILALFLGIVPDARTLLALVASVALAASWLLLSHSRRAEQDRTGWFWPTPALVVAAVLTVGSIAVVNAFATSTDLSTAKLDLIDAPPISGQVITVTEQAWYLAMGSGEIKVIDANRVTSGTVTKARSVKNAALKKTLFHLAFPLAFAEADKWYKAANRWGKRTDREVGHWAKRHRTTLLLAAIALCAIGVASRRMLRRIRRKSPA